MGFNSGFKGLTTLINEIILPHWKTLLTATRTAHLHKSGRWQDTLSKRALSGKRCFAIYDVATRTKQTHSTSCRSRTSQRMPWLHSQPYTYRPTLLWCTGLQVRAW